MEQTKCSQNFSDINPNLIIKEGNTIRTISEAKNVVATGIVMSRAPNNGHRS